MKKLAFVIVLVVLLTPFSAVSAQSEPVEYDGTSVDERLREEGLDQAPAPVDIRETTMDTPPALVTAEEMRAESSDDSSLPGLIAAAAVLVVVAGGVIVFMKRKRT